MLCELDNKPMRIPQKRHIAQSPLFSQKAVNELGILVIKPTINRVFSMFTRVFTYLETKLPVYDEADRVKWDLFVSVLILIAAFEIPYDWLVGWTDPTWAHVFNLVFFIAFSIDMVVNALSQRREQSWFVFEWWKSMTQPKLVEQSRTILLRPRETMVGYTKTIWFPIDFLSTVPWAFFAELFCLWQFIVFRNYH